MNLIEVINTIIKKHTGTFILCDKHLPEFKNAHAETMFNIRHLRKDFEGECEMCNDAKRTPIQFDKTPEKIQLSAMSDDDRLESGWSASGQIGNLHYVTDNEGRIFNTQESLYRHGVRMLYIKADFTLHLDFQGEPNVE